MDFNIYKLTSSLPAALNREENQRLIRQYQQTKDKQIKQRITEGNMRFVAYYLLRYYKYLINVESEVYPTFDDLLQEGMLSINKSLEWFNCDLNFSYTNYLGHYLKHVYSSIYIKYQAQKRKATTLSLDMQLAEDLTFHDILSDEVCSEEHLYACAELDFIKTKIVPLLTKNQQGIFMDFFFNDISKHDVAIKWNVSPNNISAMVEKFRQKVVSIYENDSI